MTENMKILHLVSANCCWEPAVRVIALAAALREHGLPSAVTTPEHSRLWEIAEAAGVEVVDYHLEASLNPLKWLDFSRLVKSYGPAVIHAHDGEAAKLLSRARMLGDTGGIATTRYELNRPPTSSDYANANAIICPSETAADSFRKIKQAEAKIRVVYGGFSLALADRAVEEREALRVRYRDAYCPHKEKPLFLVNIAPLEEESGQADLLESMTEVVAALPQVHLFIMGEGPLREELERQVKITALDRDVSFMEPDKAFTRLLSAANIFVSTSRNDISGFMVQAAMAVGRSVVLRKAGCYPEFIESGKNGTFMEGDDTEALKAALLEQLENRHQRDHLGRQARVTANRQFDISNLAGRTAEIYGEIVAQKMR